MEAFKCNTCGRTWKKGAVGWFHKDRLPDGSEGGCYPSPVSPQQVAMLTNLELITEEPMSELGTPRIPSIDGKPKARGAGQPPRKYTASEWIKGYTAWLVVFPIYLALWAYSSVFGRIPEWLRKLLLKNWYDTTLRFRDVRIPGDESIPAYMLRWWKIKRNAYLNIYYHHVRRSDDDTALHDHPWWSFSIVLEGGQFAFVDVASDFSDTHIQCRHAVRLQTGEQSAIRRHSDLVADVVDPNELHRFEFVDSPAEVQAAKGNSLQRRIGFGDPSD